MLQETGGPRRQDLDRPCRGCRRTGTAPERYGSIDPHPRAHADPRAAARAPAFAQAHQPAQRLPAYRHRCVYAMRRDRIVLSAPRHAVTLHRRANVGPDHRLHAQHPAADAGAEERKMADRRRRQRARQDAGDIRLWPHRRRRRRHWQSLRHEGSDLGA